MSDNGPGDRKSSSQSFVQGLKTEWNLFWETILGDNDNANSGPSSEPAQGKDPFVTGKLQALSLEQIKAITKALSSDRKTLNQKLEMINKEIEENATKLESLKLVGGECEETLQKLSDLSDLGQSLSEQLDKINDRLKMARRREDDLKKSTLEV